MTESQCKTNFRILPQIYAVEVAKYFELELKLGAVTQWGIGKFRTHDEPGCKHWLTCVSIGDKRYIPNLCFKTRKESEDYCERMGFFFPTVCQRLFGSNTENFSSN